MLISALFFGWWQFQACICNNFFHCRNVHIHLCWYGCIGHWQMEKQQSKVTLFYVDLVKLKLVPILTFKAFLFALLSVCLKENYFYQFTLSSLLCSWCCNFKSWHAWPLLNLQFSAGTSIAVSSTLFASVLIGRAAFVFPIAYIKNLLERRESTKISFRKQVP